MSYNYFDRKKQLSHIRDEAELQQLHQLLDKVEICIYKKQMQITDFLDPHSRMLAEGVLKGIQEITYRVWGGFEDAERARIVVAVEGDRIEDEDFQLAQVVCRGNFRFFPLSHRDVLGAVLATGLKRERTGDIIINEDNCCIVVDQKVAQFLETEITRIGKAIVKTRVEETNDFSIPAIESKSIRATVSSLRLDAVISAAYNVARGVSADWIRKEKVKVNWQLQTRIDYKVGSGDYFSVRGRGRFRVAEITGNTKKNRVAINLEIFK